AYSAQDSADVPEPRAGRISRLRGGCPGAGGQVRSQAGGGRRKSDQSYCGTRQGGAEGPDPPPRASPHACCRRAPRNPPPPDARVPPPEVLSGELPLLVEGCGLTPDPAPGLVYRDPYFDVENKRVLVENGDIVSCLTIVPSETWIGVARVGVAGIASVGTRQD